jgi:hypothetical protein
MRGTKLERFESKFVRGNGCWEWNGCASPVGYGFFYYGDGLGMVNAHRAAWMLYRGSIPDGSQVLHRCDNPSCVNPDHLFLGTHQENMDDKGAKGRQAEGEGHGLAKMNNRAVMEIRAAFDAGISPKAIGDFYGLNRTNVYTIAKRKTWDHVTDSLAGDDLEETLAILREYEKTCRAEVSKKCSAGGLKAAEGARKRAATRALETTRECKGPLCLKEGGTGTVLPVDDFYKKGEKDGIVQRMAICKKCYNKKAKDRYNENIDESRVQCN